MPMLFQHNQQWVSYPDMLGWDALRMMERMLERGKPAEEMRAYTEANGIEEFLSLDNMRACYADGELEACHQYEIQRGY